MKRKVLSVLLAMAAVVVYSVPCFALSGEIKSSEVGILSEIVPESVTVSDEGDAVVKTIVVSEEEMLKTLADEPVRSLENVGYTTAEIKEIKTLAADASDPTKTEKYGSVKYTIKWYRDGFYYKNGTTHLKTNISWSWSSVPLVNYKDIIASTTSKSFTMDSAFGHVNYYEQGIKDSAHKSKMTMASDNIKTNNARTGVYYKISMVKKRYYALGGSLTVKWSDDANIKSVGVAGNYGHAIVSISPAVSFGGKGITFTPSLSVSYGTEASLKATR